MKLLVLGEVCRDIFVYGKCERLCPEAPVPVFKPEREEENKGMAGNVVANLESLFPEADVDLHGPIHEIIKRRFVESNSGYILLRVDENDTVIIHHTPSIFNISYGDYDGVIIADYNKGFLSEGVLRNIFTVCAQKHVPTFLDTKKILGDWSKEATFVKINRKEYNESERALKLPPEYYCKNLILTLGDEGSQWRQSFQAIRSAPVDKIAVSDVSGAGDTYMAAFVLKYLKTQSVMEGMIYANKAARIAVSKRGVVAVSHEEIA